MSNLDLATIYSYNKNKTLAGTYLIATDFSQYVLLLQLFFKQYFINHLICKN